MRFPVSIKGVLFKSGSVVLLENDRGEWELPGGRLEPGETPESCLAREVSEELGISVDIGPLLDCWLFEVLPKREVLIVTYGLHPRDNGALRVSEEHRRIGLFTLDQIARIPLPRGYHRAVRTWADARGPDVPRRNALSAGIIGSVGRKSGSAFRRLRRWVH